ncbi:MerR family transcriptional regulator [Noviherbaspirillum galbum]|uniref:MerR family transcriptional regulator n=1 Tax=Noviherbaspirillum galbum TaxID=2709383 RepID=A0A6B3SUV1_9BURK|nr:MerR family transcriptional regulator [Noviherbaspirillum galbum]NEX64301.1 MerR family transcriptional regulator [Noviherbaspirillum galbum]
METTLSIGAVERDTGLSKDTLRVWERRYGFPKPMRDALGERVYPLSQVERLRVIKRLLDQGHRPGRVMACSEEELAALAAGGTRRAGPDREAAPAEGERADLLQFISLCKECRFEELRRQLSQELLRIGMYRFVVDVIAPLNSMVGLRWANGSFAVFEEHLYTESVQIVMRNAIAALPQHQFDPAVRPRLLLTTFPNEQHGLGLLMAEAIFALEGARCISLGVQTPILEIVRAAEAQDIDVVALSFSAALNPNSVLESLRDLREKLPAHREIWVGGEAAVLRRRPPRDVKVLGLGNIRDAIIDWKLRRAVPASA